MSPSEGKVMVIYGAANASSNIDTINPFQGFTFVTGLTSITGSMYVSGAGDRNHDGLQDIAIGLPTYDGTGLVIIVFGSETRTESTMYMSDLDFDEGYLIYGSAEGGQCGMQVRCAGDVNNDTYADLIIGCNEYDGQTGIVYVIHGASTGALVHLSELNNEDGFVIVGRDPFSRFGSSVAGVGDVNGDGFDDIAITTSPVSPDNYYTDNNVALCIVYGSAQPVDVSIREMDALHGVLYVGYDGVYTVSAAGDFNNDGYADVLLGARKADLALRPGAGRAFVLYGRTTRYELVVELSSVAADSSAGIELLGAHAGDSFGAYLSGGADLNGDGVSDVIISAILASPASSDGSVRESAGIVYVVYGGPDILSYDMQSFESGLSGFKILGAGAGDRAGRAVTVGDFNHDGAPDIAVGAPQPGVVVGDSLVDTGPGVVYVLYGNRFYSAVPTPAPSFKSTLPPVVTVFQDVTLSATSPGIIGATLNKLIGGTMTAGDVNGDGVPDYIVSSLNYPLQTGTVYVVYGNATGLNQLSGVNLDNMTPSVGYHISSTSGDMLGVSLAFLGDVNGDGVGDFAIGTNGVCSCAFVIYGTRAPRVSLDGSALDSTDGTCIRLASGGIMDFGTVVSAAGDMNHDGRMDFAVSGPSGGLVAIVFGSAHFDEEFYVMDEGSASFVIYGSDGGEVAFGQFVSAAGDLNGDGFDDIVVGSTNGAFSSVVAGCVVFGHSNQTIFNVVNLMYVDLEPGMGFTILSSTSDQHVVSGAGDVNNDGFADIIISTPAASPLGRLYAGVSFVIFGQNSSAPFGTLDLDSFTSDPSFGFKILGASAWDGSGASASRVGDVNGDGIDDIAVSALSLQPQGVGHVNVIFGRARGVSFHDIDLSTFYADTRGFRVFSPLLGSMFGCSLVPAGDANRDGIDDFLVGAPLAAVNGVTSGRMYVVLGQVEPVPSRSPTRPPTRVPSFAPSLPPVVTQHKDLPLSGIQPGTGIVFDGAAVGDQLGFAVSAGDLNGDGLDDLLLTAQTAFNGSGVVYVLLNQGASGSGVSFPVTRVGLSISAQLGYMVVGAAREMLGGSVSAAGDVNGDGVGDFIVGRRYSVGGIVALAYVIYGKSGFARATVAVGTSMPITDGFRVNGDAASAFYDTSVSGAGDVNGDGLSDVIVGAPGMGMAFVVFGARFQSRVVAAMILSTTMGFRIQAPLVLSGTLVTLPSFGAVVSSAGDVNDDGFDDVMVGSVGPTEPQRLRGVVVFGHSNRTSFSSVGFSETGVATESFSGFTISGKISRCAMSSAGDFNHDGYDDMLIGASFLSPTTSLPMAGVSFVIFGRAASSHFTAIDVGTFSNSAAGFRITGGTATQLSGHVVAPVGDINGDGIDDLTVSTYGDGGSFYVLFGHTNATSFPDINLANFYAYTRGFHILSALTTDEVGRSVSAGGDLNQDGIGDLIVGASGSSGAVGERSGRAYVIYGTSPTAAPTTAPTTRPSASPTLPPVVTVFNDLDLTLGLQAGRGFQINGGVANQNLGYATTFGDVNGDNISDVLVSSVLAVYAGRSNCGLVSVIFGQNKSSVSTAGLDLASLESSVGVIIYGRSGDGVGYSVSVVGDVNGDGINDIAVGAPNADASRGRVYIVFGRRVWTDVDVSMLSVTSPASGYTIFGFSAGQAGSRFGTAVSAAKDFNGDGLADILVSAPFYSRSGSGINGRAVVLFGERNRTGNVRMDNVTSSQVLFLTGGVMSSRLGSSLSGVGDVNGDGFDDILVGSFRPLGQMTPTVGALVLFGHNGSVYPEIISGEVSPGAGYTIGVQSGGLVRVARAGDFNGDGFADVVVGTTAGTTRVLFGHNSSIPFASEYLENIQSSTAAGFKIVSVGATVVSSAGDLNDDGIDDIALGASSISIVYVLFGHTAATPFPDLPLGETFALQARGFRIVGQQSSSFGAALGSAGDFNGDGISDLVATATQAKTLGRQNSGAAYIIYGMVESPTAVPSASPTIVPTFVPTVLPTLPPVTTVFADYPLSQLYSGAKSSGFAIFGSAEGNFIGRDNSVSSGDVNDDGLPDLLVSSSEVNYGDGVVYVIFGRNQSFHLENIDLANFTSAQGVTISGSGRSMLGAAVSIAGDVNGDRIEDMLIACTAMNNQAGVVYVIYGSRFLQSMVLGGSAPALPPSAGFKILGTAAFSGSSLSQVQAAGDFNKDGHADLIVSSPTATVAGDGLTGVTTLLLGAASSSDIDLSAFGSTGHGFTIVGVPAAQSGYALSFMDMNGDGFSDVVLGSWRSDDAGVCVAAVVFGFDTTFTALVDINLNDTMPHTQGFRVVSKGTGLFSASNAGDINGDGYDDLIVGVPSLNSLPGRDQAGVSFVIFGHSSNTIFETVYLDNFPASSSRGFKVLGAVSYDKSGSDVGAAGDFNNDGYADFMIGSTQIQSRTTSVGPGIAYVIFGHSNLTEFGQIDLKQWDTTARGVRLYGNSIGDSSAILTRGVSDINGDGISDIVVGTASGSYEGRIYCGVVYVVYGGQERPTSVPTVAPTINPTEEPTSPPSNMPSLPPTRLPSLQPSSSPVADPTKNPTFGPTDAPSLVQTLMPVVDVTSAPSTKVPSATPSGTPNAPPTAKPSASPSTTQLPINQPTALPSTPRPTTATPTDHATTSAAPTKQPNGDPTAQPVSAAPSWLPSADPSAAPTTATPTVPPSAEPTDHAISAAPTKQPNGDPTAQPVSAAPSWLPSADPSAAPSHNVTVNPTVTPSVIPSAQPTAAATGFATANSTVNGTVSGSVGGGASSPSEAPTSMPTRSPSFAASPSPSDAKTMSPTTQAPSHRANTSAPTAFPTEAPTSESSTMRPSGGSVRPSASPTTDDVTHAPSGPIPAGSSAPVAQPVGRVPTSTPSAAPSVFAHQTPTAPEGSPSLQPTGAQTFVPSVAGTVEVSAQPSANAPTSQPSFSPTASQAPSSVGSKGPQTDPTTAPTPVAIGLPISNTPTMPPSESGNPDPVGNMTFSPTVDPTQQPSKAAPGNLTMDPSADPTAAPTVATHAPTLYPSAVPTVALTANPSAVPTVGPSFAPTSVPTFVLSSSPSQSPSAAPSAGPGFIAPGLVSAAFVNDGTNVVILFDAKTNRGGVSTQFACSLLFGFACAEKSTCVWSSASNQVSAYVSTATGCASVGSLVSLASTAVIKAECSGCDSTSWPSTPTGSMGSTVTIESPAAAVSPVVTISAPNSIGECDSLTLDTSSSTGNGGRAWASRSIQVTSAAVTEAAAIQQLLTGTSGSSSAAVIPSSYFAKNNQYAFQVSLCNFLGQCSQASKTVSVMSTTIPTVTLPGASTRTVKRSASVVISSDAFYVPCQGVATRSGLTYAWAVSVAGVVDLTVTSASRDPSKLLIPANTLRVGSTYDVVLTVTIASTQQSASASMQVLVASGAIVPVIAQGLSRSVRVGGNVVLDASSSFDEDQVGLTGGAAGLQYSWTCVQTSPVLASTCADVLAVSSGNGSSFSASALSSAAGAVVQVTLTLLDAAQARSAQSVVTIAVLPALSPLVTISSNLASSGVLNSNRELQLVAAVSFPRGYNGSVAWSVDDTSAFSLGASAKSPLVSLIGTSGVTQSIYLVIAANSLPDRSTLTFALTARLFSSEGTASVASVPVTVNAPPMLGTFTVAPRNGTEIVDPFTFVAAQWVDSDLPLQYQFAYVSPSGAEVTLRSKMETAYTTLVLTAGLKSDQYAVGCVLKVFDALSAVTSATDKVTVLPQTTPRSTAELASLVRSSLRSGADSVDGRKQSAALGSYLLNQVDCSAAPNCSALNRHGCFRTQNTCGMCVSNAFLGTAGDSNELCVLSSSISASIVGGACSSSVQCSAFETCGSDEVCARSLMQCKNNCSSPQGFCKYVDINSGAPVSACYVGDTDCAAQCECNTEFIGSETCRLNSTQLLEKQDMRLQLLRSVEELVALEDADLDTVEGWINTLLQVAQVPDELSGEAAQVLLSIADSIIAAAEEVGVSIDTVASLMGAVDAVVQAGLDRAVRRRRVLLVEGSTEEVRRLLSVALDQNSSLARSEATVASFRAYLENSLVPGQDAVELVLPQLRVFSQVVAVSDESSTSSISASVPLTALEIANGQAASVISVPTSADQSSLRVSLSSVRSEPYNTNLGLTEYGQLFSNPLTVDLSGSTCAGGECWFEMTLQTGTGLSSGADWKPAAETFNTTCSAGDPVATEVACSDGTIVPVTCDGKTAYTVESRCPVTTYSPVCNALAGTGVTASGCRVVSRTETSLTCSCPLGAGRRLQGAGTAEDDDAEKSVSVSYVGMLSQVKSNFVNTIISAQGLNASSLEKGWSAMATVGSLALAILFAFYWSHHADADAEKIVPKSEKMKQLAVASATKEKEKDKAEVRRSRVVQMKRGANIVVNRDVQIAEQALPTILSSQTLSKRVTTEVKQHHKWFGIVFHFSRSFPRVLRVASLATNVIIMLFIQSLTYALTNGDDGTCETYQQQATCIEPSSAYATGSSKCYWSETTGKCAFVEPDSDIKVILFVAIFSALVCTPFALLVDYIIIYVLSAPTKITSTSYAARNANRNRLPSASVDFVETTSPADAAAANRARTVSGDVYEMTNTLMMGSSRRRTRTESHDLHDYNRRRLRTVSTGSELFEIVPGQVNTQSQQSTPSHQDHHDSNTGQRDSMFGSFVVLRDRGNSTIDAGAQLSAQSDLRNLVEDISNYRFTLSDAERAEFDLLWGLDENGFFKTDEELHSGFLQRVKKTFSFGSQSNAAASGSVSQRVLLDLRAVHETLNREEALAAERKFDNRQKGRRLLFLFQRDLLPGVSGMILESKGQRDNISAPQVSREAKFAAWTFLAVANVGMLFYILLFALSQTTHRQGAWAMSFALWLVVEILLVSSATVVFTHILVPSLIMQDVKKIKMKLVESIRAFNHNVKNRTIFDDEADVGENGGTNGANFNAANYLFTSTRLAKKWHELREAQIIAQFRTPWPKQSYMRESSVSKSYSKKYTALTRSASIVAVFFFTQLLQIPPGLQDMVVQMVATASIGYTVLLHMDLYHVFPLLVCLPLLLVIVIVHFILQSGKGSALEELNRMAPPPAPKAAAADSAKVVAIAPAGELQTSEKERYASRQTIWQHVNGSFDVVDDEAGEVMVAAEDLPSDSLSDQNEGDLHMPSGSPGTLTQPKGHVNRKQSVFMGMKVLRALASEVDSKTEEKHGPIDVSGSSRSSHAAAAPPVFRPPVSRLTRVPAPSSDDDSADFSDEDTDLSATSRGTRRAVPVGPTSATLSPLDDSELGEDEESEESEESDLEESEDEQSEEGENECEEEEEGEVEQREELDGASSDDDTSDSEYSYSYTATAEEDHAAKAGFSDSESSALNAQQGAVPHNVALTGTALAPYSEEEGDFDSISSFSD